MTGLDYNRVMKRTVRLMAALFLLGGAIWYVAVGWNALLSFTGGAIVAGLSFWLLHRLVSDIGKATEGGRVGGPSMVLHTFRMLILGGTAYVIVNSYGSHRLALASGLVIAVSAATLEVLIELFYARA